MSGDPKDTDDLSGLDPEQMAAVQGEILAQEEENQASILGSQADFEVWMSSHPSLSKIVMVENFSDILPSIFNFFRAMLGFEIPERRSDEDRGADAGDPNDEPRS